MRNFWSSASTPRKGKGRVCGEDHSRPQASNFLLLAARVLRPRCLADYVRKPHFTRRDHIREIVESVCPRYVAGSFTADDVHPLELPVPSAQQHEQPPSNAASCSTPRPNERTIASRTALEVPCSQQSAGFSTHTPPKLLKLDELLRYRPSPPRAKR